MNRIIKFFIPELISVGIIVIGLIFLKFSAIVGIEISVVGIVMALDVVCYNICGICKDDKFQKDNSEVKE